MSKVRINDLAREMEVKSRQILDILAELGLAQGKTHSSSLEEDEAEKVRTHLGRGSKPASHSSGGSSRASQTITPKIDLSHVSKPGDALKAVLAAKQKEEQEARQTHAPVRTSLAATPAKPAPATPPAAAATPVATAPARPEPRKIFPPTRQAPPIVVTPPSTPAIASRPPAGTVVAKPPVGAVAVSRPVVVVAPPAGSVVVKPAVMPATKPDLPVIEPHRAVEKPAAVKTPATATPAAPAPQETAVPVVAEVAAPQRPAVPTEAPVESAPDAIVSKAELSPTVHQPENAAASEPPATGAAPAETPIAAPPVRRMVMPQTGPRPVYKAPIVQAPTAVATGNQVPGAGIPRRALAAISHDRRQVRPQRLASSQAARDPSIRHVPPWADLPAAQPAHRAPALVSAHGLDLARAPDLAVRRVPAQAEHRLPPRVRVRPVRPISVPAAAGSSIRRPRKAR